jgi:hypothetical protein
MFMSLNLLLKSHPPLPKLAVGTPQVSGLGVPLRMLAGTSRDAKYHTLMPELVHKLAYTPPPFALKDVPNDVACLDATPQPLKPPLAPQSALPIRLPVSPPGPTLGLQPGEE